MLELFRQQFLGTTKAAKKVVIENEDAIYFSYDNKKKQLLAFSDEDLEILNPYYGYKIKFQLVQFEVSFAVLSILNKDVVRSYYAGLSRFEEIDNSKKNINRRNENYNSSSLHFFRNLAKKEFTNNDFVIFDGSFATDYNRCFVVKDTLDLKKITVVKNPKKIMSKKNVAEYNILYKKKQQSKIVFNTNLFFIDMFGNFSETESIIFSGDFSEKRIANLLPLNFGL